MNAEADEELERAAEGGFEVVTASGKI